MAQPLWRLVLKMAHLLTHLCLAMYLESVLRLADVTQVVEVKPEQVEPQPTTNNNNNNNTIYTTLVSQITAKYIPSMPQQRYK